MRGPRSIYILGLAHKAGLEALVRPGLYKNSSSSAFSKFQRHCLSPKPSTAGIVDEQRGTHLNFGTCIDRCHCQRALLDEALIQTLTRASPSWGAGLRAWFTAYVTGLRVGLTRRLTALAVPT